MFDSHCTVLLCEDDESDVILMTRVFRKLKISNPIIHVEDGVEAIKYISGEGKYSNRQLYPIPGVIITDLKMPKAGGFEVLQWLIDHPEQKVMPIAVLSSSNLPADIRRAYDLGASYFLAKTAKPKDFEDKMRVLFEFWNICEFPPQVRM